MVSSVIKTKVSSFIGAVTQPNEYDCQSAAIHMVTGGIKSIYDIRSELEHYGNPGDPANMGETIKAIVGAKRYSFNSAASIQDMRDALNAGAVAITHGWFSRSGHVIVLDGRREGLFDVADPYEEFSASVWDYPNRWGWRNAYDGYYSELLIYAACVAGNSRDEAWEIYQQGKIDVSLKNAWLHVIK